MIRAKDIMTTEVITINPDSGILQAAKLITSKSVSGLVVVDKENPVAVISESDIIKGMISKKSKVKDVMEKDFVIVQASTSFAELNKLLREKKIRRFPVVENGKLAGLITEMDIIESTRDFTKMHQIVQDTILAAFGLATVFFLIYYSPLWPALFG